MRSRGVLVAVVVAVIAGGAAAIARAEVDRNIYRSGSVGVEIVFPADWAVSEQASYPYLLASAMDRALGGRMTLTLEAAQQGEKLRDVAERNRTTLRKVGFKVQQQAITQHPTGALVFEVVTPDGRGVVRQAYRQFDETGPVFVLSLAAPRETMQRYRRAFDDALRGLTRTRVRTTLPKPATGAPPATTTPPAPVPAAPESDEPQNASDTDEGPHE
jgi:hypothetical protein